MNPLWGLKPLSPLPSPLPSPRSQKHESSLGIETGESAVQAHRVMVPKSMNPLWGLKQLGLNETFDRVAAVPKRMNPRWGLKRTIASLIYL